MIDDLLHRLERVKQTGPDRWTARCPAHNDKGPSLAIRETDDGRVLIHCFAGCDTHSILAAVGLDMTALFPERPTSHGKPTRRPFPATDVLRCLSAEVNVIAIGAAMLERGELVTGSDLERFYLACRRVQNAADLTLGRA